MKRTVKDLVGLKGKTVLVRVDFNVPVDENGKILDNTRVVKALPTIRYLVKQKAKVVLMSHLGRPKEYDMHKSLWPVAMLLKRALRCSVSFCNEFVGEEATARIKAMRDGSVLLLENTRFHKGEEACDMALSKHLASLANLYVNDAFGTAHRKNASTFGVARLLPNAIGLLMEKEVNALGPTIENPKRPFVAIIGGAKVSTKINILKRFIDKADTLIIGGAMAYTFLKAKGENVGDCLVEDDNLDEALEILKKAEAQGKKVLLPIDHVCIDNSQRKRPVVMVKKIKSEMVGYDIGEATAKLYAKEIAHAKQVLWNGPMGKFEEERFAYGTYFIAQAVAKCHGYTVVGGGDTVSAINKFKLAKKISFISTGGGATMEFLEQGSLPCIDVIQEKIV